LVLVSTVTNTKYGALVVVIAVSCVPTNFKKPTTEQRVAATAATEEILELYNADNIDEIVSRIFATPKFGGSPEEQLRFQGEMLRLLRRAAGPCPIASARYEVSSRPSDLLVEVSATCERAKVGLNLAWVKQNDQLVLNGLIVAPETAESIPELYEYVLQTVKENFQGRK
jgi:hypothetical protein